MNRKRWRRRKGRWWGSMVPGKSGSNCRGSHRLWYMWLRFYCLQCWRGRRACSRRGTECHRDERCRSGGTRLRLRRQHQQVAVWEAWNCHNPRDSSREIPCDREFAGMSRCRWECSGKYDLRSRVAAEEVEPRAGGTACRCRRCSRRTRRG